MTFSIII